MVHSVVVFFIFYFGDGGPAGRRKVYVGHGLSLGYIFRIEVGQKRVGIIL